MLLMESKMFAKKMLQKEQKIFTNENYVQDDLIIA